MGDAAMIQLNGPTDAAYGFKLGDEIEQNGNRYKFVQAGAAIATGQAVLIDPVTFEVVEATTALAVDVSAVGVTVFAFAASAEVGWVQTKGNFQMDVATGLTAGQLLHTSATAGRLGASGGGAVLVTGASVVANTSSAGLAACYAVTDMFISV
jgi:hypothetical protein